MPGFSTTRWNPCPPRHSRYPSRTAHPAVCHPRSGEPSCSPLCAMHSRPAWRPPANMTSTSKTIRQSPHPNPLPYSADGMGEGTGGATSENGTFNPRADGRARQPNLHETPHVGRAVVPGYLANFAGSRQHFRPAWCARARAQPNTTSIPKTTTHRLCHPRRAKRLLRPSARSRSVRLCPSAAKSSG